jgi:hypothetical protein
MEAPRRVMLKRTLKRIRTTMAARTKMTFRVPGIRLFLPILTPFPAPDKREER